MACFRQRGKENLRAECNFMIRVSSSMVVHDWKIGKKIGESMLLWLEKIPSQHSSAIPMDRLKSINRASILNFKVIFLCSYCDNRVRTHLESPWKSVKSTLGPWQTLKFAVWLFSHSGRTRKDWDLNKSGSYTLNPIIYYHILMAFITRWSAWKIGIAPWNVLEKSLNF